MRQLLKQAIKFIGFSGIGWLIDFSIYNILGFISSNLFLNNMISSWFGVTFVFIFSTRKVFVSNDGTTLKYKYLIYILYQLVLIFSISGLLSWISRWINTHSAIAMIHQFSGLIAKIVVTPVTMILNFIVMKIVIEKIKIQTK